MKFLVFHCLEFSLTIFAIALCDLSPILPNSLHLQFHGHRASSALTNRFLHKDLFWVSILASLELKLSSSVRLALHHASPPSASAILFIIAICLSSCHPRSGAASPTPLQLVLSFEFGFMFMLFMLLFLELVCEDFYCLMPVCFSPSRMLSVPSFHWHPFGYLVRCLLVNTFGCLWVLPL
jgi:hypothetical protein